MTDGKKPRDRWNGAEGSSKHFVSPDRTVPLASPSSTSVSADPSMVRQAGRVQLFQRRGIAEQGAVGLAEVLRRRDTDFDDRRMCIECAHLQRDGGCFAARQGWIQGAAVYLSPIRTMLQRCERFEPQGALSC
jgi:hypothetical protein